MCILILILSVFMMLIYPAARYFHDKSKILGFMYDTDMDESLLCIGMLCFGVSFIASIALGIAVSKGTVINDNISMYEQENKIIESQIDTVITNYMYHEQSTFNKCSAESMITLVDMYPELKSDTLISKQINVYLDNNKEIKSLKKAQINQKVYRWWLYFG